MSNKADATKMKPKKQPELTPKLRFPEFQDAPEWEQKTLDGIASFYKGKGISKADINLQGETLCIRYGELYTIYGEIIKTVFSKTKLPASELFLSQENDVIIPSSGETKIDIARASCVLLNDVALGGDLNILRSDENGVFLSYLLNGPYKREIAKKAQGDTVAHLYASQLKLLEIVIPKDAEQQKIADCLSSLDDLIAAQGQKLGALKSHKKGLMQQLFPAAGETLPQLRFPEFQDAPEWEDTTIGQISKNITAGGTPSTLKKEYWNGNIRWMNSGELNHKKVYEVQGRITDEGLKNSSTKLIPSHCVLIGLAGQGKTRGTVAMNMVELCVNQSIAAIFPNKKIFDSNFLYHNLDNRYDELRRLSTGGEGRGGLNLQIIKSLKIDLPSLPEQQKVADFISSLDEQIAAQSQKLGALKSHKKGLMQQLFPSAEEVLA